jgi:hypothetical protein
MDEDVFNLSIRKFLKKVGITSQREIEKAIRDALVNGQLKDDDILDVRVELKMDQLPSAVVIDGKINLK